MSRLDIIVFGATGFTGKIVIKKLVHILKCSDYIEITWGLAGRSVNKLKSLLKDVDKLGVDVSKIPLITADVNDEKSLILMTEQCKVLMNCVGPYTILGKPVLKACIDSHTHYVDITAELYYMLDIYKTFNKAAEAENVLIIPCCGYGSIPAAMGLVALEKQFQGSLQSVDCYTALDLPGRLLFPGCGKTLVHYGTWNSLVYELRNFRRYQALKEELFPNDTTEMLSKNSKRGFFHRSHGKIWFQYPGPDKEVIAMSERYLQSKENKKPIAYNIYTTMPLLIHLLIIPVFLFYYYACYLGCFRKLLRSFPRFFTCGYMSHKGPSDRNRSDTKFSFTSIGKGLDTKDLESGGKEITKCYSVKVSGADAYGMTAIAFILSAITMLKDSNNMPKGGVIPIGGAFYHTNLIERLKNNGLNFETSENIE